ncbi:MAG: hemerythrin domain-containing protein [Rikenellaceae bacterium]|nr:hemerythrin domain-containing protein [Rikenellaceae bacterium]
MYRLGRYREDDRMGDLISDNYSVLLVLSRFGISLGFGDSSIGQVCCKNGVDVTTFLSVVNFMISGEVDLGFSIESMVGYLHRAHDYYLDYRLPAIRAKLTEVMGDDCGDVSRAVMRFFDDYCAEVGGHMSYEEQNVFPYVRELLAGHRKSGYDIGIFRKRHDRVEAKLTELKNILIKYYPGDSSNELNGVLFDIFACEQDLASHNMVEDVLFVPAVTELERKWARGSK